MKYETSGARIRQRRKELKLTQRQLSRKIGVSAASITQWETDVTNPGGERLYLLSKALNCSQNWLLYGGDPDEQEQPLKLGPNLKGLYPSISWTQAAAENPIEEANKADSELHPCPVKCSANTFVLIVQGASMEPLFQNGDLIFVDPEKQAEHDSHVVIKGNGDSQANFKQLVIDSGTKFLKPVNKDWPEQFVKLKESALIVGVVVFSGRRYQP